MQPPSAPASTNPADYMAAAAAYYAPQQASELATDQTTNTEAVNTLEAEKGQIGTNYTSAINNLNTSVQNQTGTINQLYTSRLGGNFSGLQGNDLGEMYASANNQEATIEDTRTNALNSIAVQETNADLTAETEEAELPSKYASLEEAYAGSAATAANTQNNSDRTYNLDVYKADTTAANDATSTQNAYLDKFTATPKTVEETPTGKNNLTSDVANKSTSNGFDYTGPNGETINLGQYASVLGQGDANSTLSIVKNQLQQSGTAGDKAALSQIDKLGKQGSSADDILAFIKTASNKQNSVWYSDFNGAF